jgi:hypothetical protein
MAFAVVPRVSLYFLANAAFAFLVGIAYVVGGYPNPRLLHLALLFALCSTSIIDLDGPNGRFALLALFMLIYFVSFGVGDLSNILNGSTFAGSPTPRSSPGAISMPEAVILVGGVMLVLGYRAAVFIAGAKSAQTNVKDWSRSAILLVGLIFWTIGTIATYRWNVYVVTETTDEALRKGLASLGPLAVTGYMLAQTAQPLGILLLAYAYRAFRSHYLLPIIIGIVCVQLFIGFVVDIKGLAILGLILVIVTSVLVDGRVPKVWLFAFALFVVLLFPIFQAYRGAIHGNVTRTSVVENFGKILEKTIAAKDRVNSGQNRAQTFLERGSLKGSVEVIVERTGNGVQFQNGHTLSPLLATFVPTLLWSDKRPVQTGRLLNSEFHMVDSDSIWISPSHLGELYWNFGWPGVVLGMGAIGLICGWVGARFNIAEYRTVTRVLVTVITIKQLIVGFEGAISDIYVVWLRSLAGVGILHLLFARVRVYSRLVRTDEPERTAPHTGSAQAAKLFPNLLT